MFCQQCGQKEATLHYVEADHDQAAELYLCEECARKKGAKGSDKFSFSNMVAGISALGRVQPKTAELKCPNCGLTYAAFGETGRFGCSECYTAFAGYIDDLLKRVQRSHIHEGKIPKAYIKVVLAKKKERLKQELEKAIQMEQYEQAAKIRDAMKGLEGV